MKKVTRKNMADVWAKLLEYADTKDERECVAQAFNEMLDTLANNDFFGTEGQCDPRVERHTSTPKFPPRNFERSNFER